MGFVDAGSWKNRGITLFPRFYSISFEEAITFTGKFYMYMLHVAQRGTNNQEILQINFN
jgi:hypothetical protein